MNQTLAPHRDGSNHRRQGTANLAFGHSKLEPTQQVELFPNFGYQLPGDTHWHAQVSGMVFQEAGVSSLRQRVFLRVLRQLLLVDENQLAESEIFQERIAGFLHEPQRAVNVVVQLGREVVVPLRRSKRNGHFRGVCHLHRDDLVRSSVANATQHGDATQHSDATTHRGATQINSTGVISRPNADEVPGRQLWTDCRVLLAPDDARDFRSHMTLLSARGVSVISDIDDTIKISQVAHRRRLLHNTFMNPFATVGGMSELYQSWADRGAAFHYVSSSPWQLFRPLQQLLLESAFPMGSYHLRTIRFSDPSVLQLFMSRKRNKFRIIKSIIRQFPQRRFVLVGDSGERDPEIYGAIARRYPHQVERILIRRVEGKDWTRRRVTKAFGGVPRKLWQTFHIPTQVKEIDLTP